MELLINKVFLERGKRANVYLAEWKGKKVVVKEKRPDSTAVLRMENEAYWLRRLNRVDIGPKFYFSGRDFVVMEYVKGKRIIDWAAKHYKKEVRMVLLSVLKQCRKLDRLRVNKEEMHHPVKHVIIRKSKVIMIDFERCHVVKSPQNVTQFCQFIVSRKFLLANKKDVIGVLRDYKRDYSEKNFRKILRALSL